MNMKTYEEQMTLEKKVSELENRISKLEEDSHTPKTFQPKFDKIYNLLDRMNERAVRMEATLEFLLERLQSK